MYSQQSAERDELSSDECKKSCGRAPPGSCVIDHSIHFWRDAVEFYRRRSRETQCPLFRCRFLLKPTLFVGSNETVRELLDNEDDSAFRFGYKDYLSHVYGDVVLFSDGENADEMRQALQNVFSAEQTVSALLDKSRRIVEDYFGRLSVEEPICVYTAMKRLASMLLISLFLDLEPSSDGDLIEQVIQLSVAHWHGIISLPVNVKIPLFGMSSGYRKAVDSRNRLMELVRQRVEEHKIRNELETAPAESRKFSFLNQILDEKLCNFGGDLGRRLDHLVLLVSALIPKALASLITSAIVNSSMWISDYRTTDCDNSAAILRAVLLECGRLWPPFIGGRRVAEKAVSLSGYGLPKNHSVVYLTIASHRDPLAFTEPEKFNWQRWSNASENELKKLYTFGAGRRCCIGKTFMEDLLELILRNFLDRFNFKPEKSNNGDPTCSTQYKWLPVSRPNVKPLYSLTYRKGGT